MKLLQLLGLNIALVILEAVDAIPGYLKTKTEERIEKLSK